MALIDGDEQASLRAAQAGSVAGFESLFRAGWPRAFRASYLIVLDHAAAEQVVLECFLAAVRSLDGFHGDRPFVPWLHGLVVNRSIDRARARAFQPSGFRGGGDESTTPLEWAIPIGGPHLDPAAITLASGLFVLSPDLRAAIVLRYLLDYRTSDAPQLLDVSKQALEARVERARSYLRNRFGGVAVLDEKTLRTLLLQQPVAGEQPALERTWEIVASAYQTREPVPRARRLPVRFAATVLALGAIGVAVWLSPAGSWIADRFSGESDEPAASTTVAVAPSAALPTTGRVLVAGRDGISLLDPNGVEAALGAYAGGSWSPTGKFVAAWRRRILVGFDVAQPDTLLWQVERRGVADARWSDDGFRVAYRARRSLRLVDGSGSDDRRLATGVAPVAPAWRPGEEHVLAYADLAGRVKIVDADARRRLWQLRAADVVALAWIAPERLAVLAARDLSVVESPRNAVASVTLPEGAVATALAARPAAAQLAYAVFEPATRTASVFLLDPEQGEPRLLFAGRGPISTLVWSPDGRYLLVPWRQADQWLFLPVDGGEPSSVPEAARLLGHGGFPRPIGWCCAAEAG